MTTPNTLLEKWDSVLNHEGAEKIPTAKEAAIAQLLENTAVESSRELNESQTTDGVDVYNPVLISLVRRMAPRLISFDVMGTQVMTGPTGVIFAARATKGASATTTPAPGDELLFNEADGNVAGSASPVQAGNDPWDVGFNVVPGQARGTASETATWAEAGLAIERITVTAATRKLRSEFSRELERDMRSVHGLSADVEFSNLLVSELIAETNREAVRTIYLNSKVGAQNTATAGTFDLLADSDGRWLGERVKGLRFAIETEANAIMLDARRGKGNIIICTANVATALEVSGQLDFSSVLAGNTDIDVDAAGATYAGKMGRFKVYIDPYLGTDGFVVGYRGSSQYDAGLFYCPYTPVERFDAVNPATLAKVIGYQTRYAITRNPFAAAGTNNNPYYRKVRVTGL